MFQEKSYRFLFLGIVITILWYGSVDGTSGEISDEEQSLTDEISYFLNLPVISEPRRKITREKDVISEDSISPDLALEDHDEFILDLDAYPDTSLSRVKRFLIGKESKLYGRPSFKGRKTKRNPSVSKTSEGVPVCEGRFRQSCLLEIEEKMVSPACSSS